MSCPLSEAQRAAVQSSAQSLLIIAGPGAGKTHTLVNRIIVALPDLAPGQRALAITFTRKAAGEMRDRLARQGVDVDRAVFVGTFHQWCWWALSEHDRVKGRSIASPDEILAAAEEAWPDAPRRGRRERIDQVSRWKAQGLSREEAPAVVREFDQVLRARGLYDFDDVLLEMIRLLDEEPRILAQLRRSFPQVFIDEYQDINPAQHRLICQLVGDVLRLTAIGDPHQAIYGFRGSDVGFFHRFREDFRNAETVELEENYRSAPQLLEASVQMISGAPGVSVPHRIARLYSEGRLTVRRSPTDKAEAEYVVHTIEQLVGGTSMFSRDSGRVAAGEEGDTGFGEIAVLYRLKSQAHELRKAFERSGIPFHVVGEAREGEDVTEDLFAERFVEPEIDAERVTLMTLHAAKGLEFDAVFIIGCEEGIIPLALDRMTGDPEEERRVFYVGMTRAKRRLYLVSAERRMLYGERRQFPVSRFLADIEEGLKEYSRSVQRPSVHPPDDPQMQWF